MTTYEMMIAKKHLWPLPANDNRKQGEMRSTLETILRMVGGNLKLVKR